MSQTIQIRAYRNEDLAQAQRLNRAVKPYQPEDQAVVEAMFARGEKAEQENDPRWMAQQDTGLEETPDSYTAFWVAEQIDDTAPKTLVGTLGVRTFTLGLEIPATATLAQKWHARGDVLSLCRMRVLPEVRRQGVGRQLCQAAIDWSRQNGYGMLVVNTTTPQVPAIQLYQSVGFQEVGHSFIGKYELAWLELAL